MQELLHAHWSVLATVCLICCCAFLLNDALFFHLMQSQLWKLNIGKRVTVNFRETSTDEPQILTQLHSDDQCTIMHKSLIWCIMTFVSLFQTLHFIPDRATDWLLQFIGILLKFLGRYSDFIAVVAANIPTSVYMRNKQLFGGGSEFIKYVVCPECHSLYNFEDCLEKSARII